MLLIVRDKADLLGRLTAHRVRAPTETILWLVAPPPDNSLSTYTLIGPSLYQHRQRKERELCTQPHELNCHTPLH